MVTCVPQSPQQHVFIERWSLKSPHKNGNEIFKHINRTNKTEFEGSAHRC